MEELLGISPATTAALIAAAATLGMFWAKAKSIAMYLSSFVLVTASYDSTCGVPIRRYLKAGGKYHKLPGGSLTYEGINAEIEGRPAGDRRVPLRHKLASTSLMFGPGGVIMVRVAHSSVEVIGLRWLFDPDRLVSDALDWTAFTDGSSDARDRFYVYNIVGTEKGAWVSHKTNRGSSDVAEAPVGDSSCPLDSDLDISFKYNREQWGHRRDFDPFEHLYYPPEVLRHVDDLRRWRQSGDWYKERGIPWRRGVLLYGPPGTGKSSLAKAIAQYMGMPLYVFHLATLSDQEFTEAWRDVSGPCMILFEDFDTVFNGRTALTNHQALTFECILNAISGVNTQTGVVLVVTTNHLENIDDALKNRPGRIDATVELGTMQVAERTKLAAQTLRDWPELIPEAVAAGDGMAAVQFSEHCIQVAFNRMHMDKREAA